MTNDSAPPAVDSTRPSVARIYDVMLGGKDNFEVDRNAAAEVMRNAPDTPTMLRNNRRWLQRAVRWLAREADIDQFLDVGSGLPTAENTHEIAQAVNPDARVVYVDNDPTAIAFGRALLDDDDHSFFVAGDLSKPTELLDDPAVAGHLDLDRPIALFQCATLHFVPGQANAERIMREYVDLLAPGSYVGITHGRIPEPDDFGYEQATYSQTRFGQFAPTFTPRSTDDITGLFGGLDMVPPGVVPIDDWWPGGPQVGEPSPLAKLIFGGLARKPEA